MSEAGRNSGDPHRHSCPECAAPRALDGTPSCPCNRRVSEALREARTAQAAAAEDFNPLRIRPYVELGGGPEGPPADRQPDDTPTLAMPVASPPVRRVSVGVHRFEQGAPGPGGPEPSPQEPSAHAPSAHAPSASAEPAIRPRRRRMALAAAGAAATVLAAAGLASGLFTYKTPTRDQALPDDLRASVPDPTDDTASPTAPSGAAPSAGSAARAPSVPTTRPRPAPAPSKPHASTPPSSQPPASDPAPSPSATTSGPPDSGERRRSPRTLRLGDDGPEVTELQLRLRELDIYLGDIDENYDEQVAAAVSNYQFTRDIKDDTAGVYGAPTRERLESETREP